MSKPSPGIFSPGELPQGRISQVRLSPITKYWYTIKLMEIPNQKELNDSRKEGFKPAVITCLLNNKQLLFFYKKEHRLWQLPQCSIKNLEDPIETVRRNIEEDLGKSFLTTCNPLFSLVGFDQIEMLPGKTKETEIATDEGGSVKMMGKKFYFFVVQTNARDLDIGETQFDDYLWCKAKAAVYIAGTIHQPGKKRVTSKIVSLLKDGKLIE